MKPLLLTDITLCTEWQDDRLTVRGKWNEDDGAFVVDQRGVARLSGKNPELGALLAAHGARQALHHWELERIVARRPTPETMPALQMAGFFAAADGLELPFALQLPKRGLRIVFVGGFEHTRRLLAELLEREAPPVLVIGRKSAGMKSREADPLKKLCLANDIPFLHTADINDAKVVEAIRAAAPDYLCVLGWNQEFGPELLAVPKSGALGLYPTRLPEGRGHSPLRWTLIKGLTESAISLQWLTEQANAGDLADQRSFFVSREDDAASLYNRILKLEIEQMEEALPRMINRSLPRRPQDESRATCWPLRQDADDRLDWRQPAEVIYNSIRGLTAPYSGAYTFWRDRRLTIWKADLRDDLPPRPGEPGEIVETLPALGDFEESSVLVRGGDGVLLGLHQVQWEDEEETSAYHLWVMGVLRNGVRFS